MSVVWANLTCCCAALCQGRRRMNTGHYMTCFGSRIVQCHCSVARLSCSGSVAPHCAKVVSAKEMTSVIGGNLCVSVKDNLPHLSQYGLWSFVWLPRACGRRLCWYVSCWKIICHPLLAYGLDRNQTLFCLSQVVGGVSYSHHVAPGCV